eukprot:4552947-Alexandrium_andersonii.AAC.1
MIWKFTLVGRGRQAKCARRPHLASVVASRVPARSDKPKILGGNSTRRSTSLLEAYGKQALVFKY